MGWDEMKWDGMGLDGIGMIQINATLMISIGMIKMRINKD